MRPRLLPMAALTVLAGLALVRPAPADALSASGRAYWTAPTVAEAPEPQALLSPRGWPEASAFTGFSGLSSGLLTRSQPLFWVAQTGARLVVAWRVPRYEKEPFRREAAQRDGPVWNDDAVEVFLDPGHTHHDYFQLIVNSAGTRYDGHGRDASWDADCDVKVAESEAAWTGVLSVRFAALGAAVPDASSVWGFNVAVDRSERQRPQVGWAREECNVTWVALGQGGTLHDPEHFGHLLFRPSVPVALTGLDRPWWRALTLTGGSLQAKVSASLARADGKAVWSGEAPPGAGFDLRSPAVAPGEYALRFAAGTAQEPLAFLPVRFRAAAPLECPTETAALGQTVEVSACIEAPEAPAEARLRATLRDPGGREVRSGTLLLREGRSTAPVRWSFADLAPGAYRIALQDDRRPDLSTEVLWTRPTRPTWLGSSAGKYGDDFVPRPWTPLRVAGRDPLRLACWGREYAFSAAGLLAAVRSREQELLASPMTLTATVQGKPLHWQPTGFRLGHVANGAVEFEAREAAGKLRLECQGRMEFDGFVKLRLRVSGAGPATELQALTFDIPFRKEVARLIHHYPKPSVWVSVDMKQFNARAIPPEGWSSPFLYHVWVGDEEKGLQWLCETDEGWRPADESKAIELVPAGDRTVLRLNLIGKPTRLDKPREYVFAFQASPVKPTPPDYRRWHYAQVGSYGMESQPYRLPRPPATITYPAAGNLRPERGTVEITLTPEFDSTAPGELNRSLLALTWPADTRTEPDRGAWFYWNQDDKGMRVVFREGGKHTCIYGAPFPWKAGEAHTVAFTWGEDAGIYADGKRLATGPVMPMFSPGVDLKSAELRLGGSDSDFVLRQIRGSDSVRPASTMGTGSARVEADAQTLLLDRLEDLSQEGGERRSRPARIAPGGFGTLSSSVTRVPGGFDLGATSTKTTTLDYLKDVGLQYLGFHEGWSDWQGFPRTSHTTELRSLIAGCHARDLKLILYHSWQLADTAPEYALYRRECEVIAPNAFIYTREPKQIDYPICPRSAWADFMADGIERLFRDFGPDGIYSDGLSYPSECSNALHGCGYVGEDGQRHPTVPIFATREAMKRFQHLLELQGKPTLFVCHTSGSIVLPTLAFCDAYLDGEHLTGQRRPFRVPLDAFRAEFMGHNFGIPAYFLVYDWNQGMTTPEGLALALLHDTEVPWSFEAMAPVWKAWQQFGVEGARFLPYWSNGDWLAGAPPGVMVSAYAKPGERLLVAVNTSETEVTGEVRLRTQALTAVDALDGKPVAVANGALEARFAPWRLNLWRVKVAER